MTHYTIPRYERVWHLQGSGTAYEVYWVSRDTQGPQEAQAFTGARAYVQALGYWQRASGLVKTT